MTAEETKNESDKTVGDETIAETEAEPGEEPGAKNEGTEGEAEVDVTVLEARLEEALHLADERYDQLKRCRAELDNTIKRAAREKEEMTKYASERLVIRLLGIVDSMEQAARHDEGARILRQQLLDVLRAEGLEAIDAVGKKFDPYRHEALMKVSSLELEEDTVAQELQKGYTFHSRVIRTSKVAVVKGQESG